MKLSAAGDGGRDEPTDASHGDAPTDALHGDAPGNPDVASSAEAGGCEAGWFVNGSRCVRRELFVSSDHRGSDAERADGREGSALYPFKTFDKAMSVAVAGQTVNFDGGGYDVESGDDFSRPIPAGVTVRTATGAARKARFVADGVQSLRLEADTALENVILEGFASPLMAAAGTQTVFGVETERPTDSVVLTQGARLSCRSCTFAVPSGARHVMRVHDASLTLSSALLYGPSDCAEEKIAISAEQTGQLELTGVSFFADFSRALEVAQAPGSATPGRDLKVSIRETSFSRVCSGHSLAVLGDQGLPSTIVIDIADTSFEGSVFVFGHTKSLRVRRTRFAAPVSLLYGHQVAYDFGRPNEDGSTDLGNNLFVGGSSANLTMSALSVVGTDVVLYASGNTWHPNQPDTNALGAYTGEASWDMADGTRRQDLNFTIQGHGANGALVLF